MNPTQLAFRSSILAGKTPRVTRWTYAAAAGTAATITVPRGPGKLAIAFSVCLSGAASSTPPVLTGFSSIASAAAASGAVGIRTQYRFLDGTEAATLTSTTASATKSAVAMLIVDGAISTRVPNANAASGASDPASLTATSPYGSNMLWIAMNASSNTSATILSTPNEFPSGNGLFFNDQFLFFALPLNKNIGAFDVSDFDMGSDPQACSVVCVRGR